MKTKRTRANAIESLERRVLLSTIVWDNRGTLQNDSDRFNSTFGVNAAAARAVIDGAIRSWERVIVDFNNGGGQNTFHVNISMRGAATGSMASRRRSTTRTTSRSRARSSSGAAATRTVTA